MRCCRASSTKESNYIAAWLNVYFVTQPGFQESYLLVTTGPDEHCVSWILQFDNFLSSVAHRRDPWTAKTAVQTHADAGCDSGMILNNSKIHLITFRGPFVVLRELNLHHILQYALASMAENNLLSWFKKDTDGTEIVIPVPCLVAITPFSYEDVTWDNVVTEIGCILAYSAHNSMYESISFRMGAAACMKFIRGNYGNFASRFKGASTIPAIIRRQISEVRHQPTMKVASHRAY